MDSSNEHMCAVDEICEEDRRWKAKMFDVMVLTHKHLSQGDSRKDVKYICHGDSLSQVCMQSKVKDLSQCCPKGRFEGTADLAS